MSGTTRPVEIVGGGLAGLSLGLALRHSGVPVTVFEAGVYPRHRVCGEFISGLGPATIARLGLEPHLAGAVPQDEVSWFVRERFVCRHRLPQPALAISREVLDARLAGAFTAAGGRLHLRTRIDPADQRPGRVLANGRQRARSAWVGLKAHVRGLPFGAGLEMHVGERGYAGLCRLPGGAVNVCGLFRRRAVVRTDEGALPAYLAASGLAALAQQLNAAEIVPGSEVAVAGFGFAPAAQAGEVRLGDARLMLPPLIGNGMAAAFQAAEEALGPLVAWSRRAAAWPEACAGIRRGLDRRFGRRERCAPFLHRLLLSPWPQGCFAWLGRRGLLPFALLYRLTH
ncbi:MAG TPA: hypothetical protein VL200_06610 [Lacunisphaera sp.]|jgi:flavin-dependent dehydrogenase|nr:hypothetical protein [Lacunisphaera sp.]